MSLTDFLTLVRSSLAAAAVAMILPLVVPTDAHAQQTRRIVVTDLPFAEQMEIRTRAESDDTEAGRLLNDARAALESNRFLRAANRFEASGQLRSPGSRRGVTAFEEAGRAYYNADRPRRASRAWEEAANRGLIVGQIFDASRNFMRAAGAAQRAGDRVRTSDMAWRAYHLTESPQLSKEQKETLRSHFEQITIEVPEKETLLPPIRITPISAAETMRPRQIEERYRALRESRADSTSSTVSAADRFTMMDVIHFRHDQSELSATARAILCDKVSIFRAHPSMTITITGFASAPGTSSRNRSLGLRRARAARDYLVARGIPEHRIDIATRGDNDLVVNGPGDVADAANRRGEFWFLVTEIPVSQSQD
jgi:outer membrane protein OmpA-like peptidoglycan-associated protein